MIHIFSYWLDIKSRNNAAFAFEGRIKMQQFILFVYCTAI